MAAIPAFVVILFLPFVAPCSTGGAATEADAPYNLQVAALSETSVLVGWDFSIPPGCKIEEIKFHLKCSTSDVEGRDLIVDGGRRVRFVLTDLENGTTYTAQITPMVGGKYISEPARKTFETLDRDWPGVRLKSNKVTARGKILAVYRMTWKPALPASPQRYVATVCTTECQCHHLTKPVLLYTVRFNETYNVTVTAVYAQPMVSVNRTALLTDTWSEPGAPSEVRELWPMDQERDLLQIRWKAPEYPNGPVSRYHVIISDAQNRWRKSEFSVNTTHLRERVPIPFAGYYHVAISAVNENKSSMFVGNATEYLVKSKGIAKPGRIEITERRRDCVRFSIVPADASLWDYFYRVQAKEKDLTIYTQNSTEIKNLGTYETTYLSVSTCFNDTLGYTHCSHPLYTSVTSNAEAPSKVSELRTRNSETGKPVISWSAPKLKGGPLAGYIIRILDSSNLDSIVMNKTVAPAEHEFEFQEAQDHRSYLFAIAAYNVDLNTGEKLIGEELSIEPPSGPASWILAIIVTVSLLLFYLLVLQILGRKLGSSGSNFCSFLPVSSS